MNHNFHIKSVFLCLCIANDLSIGLDSAGGKEFVGRVQIFRESGARIFLRAFECRARFTRERESTGTAITVKHILILLKESFSWNYKMKL